MENIEIKIELASKIVKVAVALVVIGGIGLFYYKKFRKDYTGKNIILLEIMLAVGISSGLIGSIIHTVSSEKLAEKIAIEEANKTVERLVEEYTGDEASVLEENEKGKYKVISGDIVYDVYVTKERRALKAVIKVNDNN